MPEFGNIFQQGSEKQNENVRVSDNGQGAARKLENCKRERIMFTTTNVVA